jgi:2-keto-4-pentenoate hydratase
MTASDTRYLDGASGVDEAARRLMEAARTGLPCAPVRDLVTDVDTAYAVQHAVVQHRLAEGRRMVGRKIGLTSVAVQRQFGVFQPDFGMLLDDMVVSDREPLSLHRFLQPRVEAEVAFVLDSDLDQENPSVADVLRAVDFVVAAIEVVDSRIAGWDITITDTVADNASSGAVVLGSQPRRLCDVQLETLGMVLEHRGAPVSVGSGAACLGSPAAAMTWLARELSRRGDCLRAGDIVLSGALGPMVAVTTTGTYRARLDGLGDVRAVFIDSEELS